MNERNANRIDAASSSSSSSSSSSFCVVSPHRSSDRIDPPILYDDHVTSASVISRRYIYRARGRARARVAAGRSTYTRGGASFAKMLFQDGLRIENAPLSITLMRAPL